jgi:acetyltransferase-like isoleucine patch superfamily enzyme
MILGKLRYILRLCGSIDIIYFIKFNLLKKYSGWFLPYTRGHYDIHKKSEIIIKNKCKFLFNRRHSSADPFMGCLIMEAGAKLIVNGEFSIFTGCRVTIFKNATLELGSGYINQNTQLACKNRITIGEGTIIAPNVIIQDSDFHEIIDEQYVQTKPIEIGNHVWIGTNVTILKGVKIGNGAIIAANSLVNKDIPAKTLVGGIPAKILKENIDWK